MAKMGNPVKKSEGEGQMAKRKQFSRNKKKNWARYLNTKDIDEDNEEKLKDMLSGGSVAGKADAELFVVDTKPDAKVRQPSVRVRRLAKQLHCEKALLPHPHTKAVGKHQHSSKRPVKNSKTQPTTVVAVTAKQTPAPSMDIWGSDAPAPAPVIDIVDSLAQHVDPKAPKTMARKPGAKVPAVRTPHAGQSYNPTFEDHVDAMQLVITKLTKDEEKEQFWRNKVGATVQQINSYATYADEMRLDQPAAEEEEEEEEIEESDSDDSDNETVSAANRKTKAQRNKEKRVMEERRKQEEDKLARQRENEVYSLRSLKRKIAEEDDARAQQLVVKEQQVQADTRPKKLSKFKYEDPLMEVQLTEELSGSLRQLKPEGNLVKDRFKSLQERNVLEVRQKLRLQRRYKLKEYEKRSFKNNPWGK